MKPVLDFIAPRKGIVAFWASFLVYSVLTWLPPQSLWFDPSAPVFADAFEGAPVPLIYSREIKRETLISYTVVVRSTDDVEPACDAKTGPFLYKPTLEAEGGRRTVSKPVADKALDWWAGESPECMGLPAGTYYVSTTWKLEQPLRAFLPDFLKDVFGWVIPPKYISVQSSPFTIWPAAYEVKG